MPFNIQEFKSKGLVGGGARPSLFDVEITFADVDIKGGLENLKFLARATQLPAMTVQSIDVPYFGRKIKVSGDRTFADWSITVMNDEDFKLRAAFENWSNKLNTIRSNINAFGNSPSSYKGTATVNQYSKAGKSGDAAVALRSYLFDGIFPTQIDAINLDWDTVNQVETFDVTFAYDLWDLASTKAGDFDSSLPGSGYAKPTTAVSGSGR